MLGLETVASQDRLKTNYRPQLNAHEFRENVDNLTTLRRSVDIERRRALREAWRHCIRLHSHCRQSMHLQLATAVWQHSLWVARDSWMRSHASDVTSRDWSSIKHRTPFYHERWIWNKKWRMTGTSGLDRLRSMQGYWNRANWSAAAVAILWWVIPRKELLLIESRLQRAVSSTGCCCCYDATQSKDVSRCQQLRSVCYGTTGSL